MSTTKVTIDKVLKYSGPVHDSSALIEPIRTGKKYFSNINPVDNSTFIGIEVEVENIHKSNGILALEKYFLWGNIEDNSLRNNGREFVSIPIKGKDIPFSIDVLLDSLRKEKSTKGFEFTDRTSTHVHLNFRDCSIDSLANLLLTYVLVEPLLYKFVGGDRAKNIFCVPITESNMLFSLVKFFKRFEEGSSQALLIYKEWLKYTGLNLIPLGNYGTIEFRHLVGTDDTDKIKTWVNLLLSIKKFASASDYKTLKERILNLNTTSEYKVFLEEVFGNLVEVLDTSRAQQIMEDTSIFVKDIFNQETDINLKYYHTETDEKTKKLAFKSKYYTHARALGLIVENKAKKKDESYGDYFERAIRNPVPTRPNAGIVQGTRLSWAPSVDMETTITSLTDGTRVEVTDF